MLAVTGLGVGCVTAQPPTDTGDITSPTAPSSPGSPSPPPPTTTGQALAYDPDMKSLFASDCVSCHSGSRPDGNYSMTTYANVMRDVAAGNANSRLVTTTRSNGSMYRYFSGSTSSRQTKSSMVYQWVVTDKAQQTK